ncbi:MAG TPA: GNAT family N-acetyltransferase [Deinococcales bacterium]|nr:GNAT family N-acetyltransferase [Deinococcales bacterium]
MGVPSGTVIRTARPSDASQLHELQEGIYAEGRWFVGHAAPPIESLRQRVRFLNPRSMLYLVAERNNQLLGWLELNRIQPQRMQHVALLTIAIGAPWRRQGLGRALLNEAYGWAARVGISKITLNVRSGNSGAIALYEAEGFRLEGRELEHFVTDDGYEDNLIMARSVD